MNYQVLATLAGIGVQTVIFLLGGYRMMVHNNAANEFRNEQLKSEVAGMKQKLETLAEVITTQAVQTTRLDNLSSLLASMEKRIEDLRRGDGYIQKRSATGKNAVDDEY